MQTNENAQKTTTTKFNPKALENIDKFNYIRLKKKNPNIQQITIDIHGYSELIDIVDTLLESIEHINNSNLALANNQIYYSLAHLTRKFLPFSEMEFLDKLLFESED